MRMTLTLSTLNQQSDYLSRRSGRWSCAREGSNSCKYCYRRSGSADSLLLRVSRGSANAFLQFVTSAPPSLLQHSASQTVPTLISAKPPGL